MSAASVPSARAAAWLARGVTATWWYTAGSVVFFALTVLFVWMLPTVLYPHTWSMTTTAIVFVVGAVLWLGGGMPLLVSYRRRAVADADTRTRLTAPVLWCLAAIVAGAVVLGIASGTVLLGAAAASFALCLLTWMPGVRLRLVLGITILLVVLWMVESGRTLPVSTTDIPLFHPAFAVALPAATVLSLWWWDVVVELDRARAIESRLAAVQERLRFASDLHDLQGHHLQVIALQLELAERMLPRDPDAAIEQVRLARASVDEARAGTRALAAQFRGVPLPDELANAADLLRAAGLRVELAVDPRAWAAPPTVLGPVVRESTTNVLKHGGGAWARLTLECDDERWTLRIANDRPEDSTDSGGSGLAGISERVGAVGGTVQHDTGEGRFELVVTVPATAGEATP